jgi:hypothetical protein
VAIVIPASVSSWLINSHWIGPASSIITALAAIAAVGAAVYVGIQASKISDSQRIIAGMAEVARLSERYDSKEFTSYKRKTAISFLTNQIDVISMEEVLNWVEEVSIYHTRKLLPLDVVEELFAFRVIYWWYVCEAAVGNARREDDDPSIFGGAAELVQALHASSRKEGISAWSQRPTTERLTKFMTEFLGRTVQP